jgi:Ca2+-transporting ATPase
MVTGDHPGTASAVAREIGLSAGPENLVSMDRAEGRPDDGQPVLRSDMTIVARALPSQKLHLVRLLQQAGEIVAVTGDGVNDAPALQAADIGIAMGERGTQTAREVAAIVLLDDNFRTIVRAVAEGRQLFRNLQLSFAYLLMVHIPLVLSAAILPLAGYPLLWLPIHIVWLELIIHPTALLVFQELPTSAQLEPLQAHRKPQFFGPFAWLAIFAVGGLVTLVIVLGYDHALSSGRGVEHARAAAIAALILASATITALLSGFRTRAARVIALGSVATLVVIVQIPDLAGLFEVAPLHLDDWTIAGAGILAGLLSGLVALATRGWRPDRHAVAVLADQA